MKNGSFHFSLKKRRVLEIAVSKGNTEAKTITGIELQTKHFAIKKFYIPEYRIGDFNYTEITFAKFTFDKLIA